MKTELTFWQQKWGLIDTQTPRIWRIWVFRYAKLESEAHNLHGPSTEVGKKFCFLSNPLVEPL